MATLSEQLIEKFHKIKQENDIVDKQVASINGFVAKLRLDLRNFEVNSAEFPEEMKAQLIKKLTAQLRKFLTEENIIESIKERIKKLLERLSEIAAHLNAERQTNKQIMDKITSKEISEDTIHLVAGPVFAAMEKAEGRESAYDTATIKREVETIDKILEEFQALEHEEEAERSVTVNIKQLLKEFGQEIAAKQLDFRAMVSVNREAKYFKNLRTSLVSLLTEIVRMHQDLRKDEAWLNNLKHVKFSFE